jgi:hypothetical protein
MRGAHDFSLLDSGVLRLDDVMYFQVSCFISGRIWPQCHWDRILQEKKCSSLFFSVPPYSFWESTYSYGTIDSFHVLYNSSFNTNALFYRYKLLTYLRSWAANCAATQELPSILWDPKVHNRVYNSPSLALSWASSIQSIPPHPISLTFILILSTHVLVFLKVSFLLAFPPITYMHSTSNPFVLHALPISSSLTWSF